jgi:excisionase family DNA binding protein
MASDSHELDKMALVVASDDGPAYGLDLLTTQQMAEAMGVSPSSVKRAAAAGLLPVVRDGRRLRFRRTETQTIEIGGGIRQRGPALEREKHEGELASACFAMFDECVPIERVVREVKAPPSLVLKLFTDWNRCRAATAQWLRPAPLPPAPQPPARHEVDWHDVKETA